MITDITNEMYVKAQGLRCPVCTSRLIEGIAEVRTYEGGASHLIYCNACESQWRDVYVLTGYKQLELHERNIPKEQLDVTLTEEKSGEPYLIDCKHCYIVHAIGEGRDGCIDGGTKVND